MRSKTGTRLSGAEEDVVILGVEAAGVKTSSGMVEGAGSEAAELGATAEAGASVVGWGAAGVINAGALPPKLTSGAAAAPTAGLAVSGPNSAPVPDCKTSTICTSPAKA